MMLVKGKPVTLSCRLHFDISLMDVIEEMIFRKRIIYVSVYCVYFGFNCHSSLDVCIVYDFVFVVCRE